MERLTAGLDEEAFSRRTTAGKWSLKELVCHLWRVQQIFEGRIDAMLASETPAITPYEPPGDTEFAKMAARPAAESLKNFLEARARLAARLESLPAGDWDRSGRHPEFPHYDVHFQMEYLAHHEAHHIYQMYQRRAPFGPIPR